MNRRDAFKLFVAGTVSLLGAKGLVDKLRERFSPYWPKPVIVCEKSLDVLRPVMGEQAHWPEDASLLDLRFDRGREDFYLPHNYMELRGKVDRFKVDGEWVETTTWSPEKAREFCQPRPLRKPQA